MQVAYAKQWGAEGRDDLGTMAKLGANGVRLYHSLALDEPSVNTDHGQFLDRAQAVGLNVMPGYDTEAVHSGCPNFDCYDTWRQATLKGFENGFRHGDGWHPAISMLILLNEPDSFAHHLECVDGGAWCRVKAVLSALDGVLAAEREAGVEAGRVRLTATWSFALMTSIDGKENGPGVFGFQDMVASIADPQLAKYTPRSNQTELKRAFETRWVHGVNTQSPWIFVKEMIANKYAKFSPIPWFIGAYGANGQYASMIQADLEDMQRTAEEKDSHFLGTAFFQFQTAYFEGRPAQGNNFGHYGLFGLGANTFGDVTPPCRFAQCRSWPVHCLSTKLSWLPGTTAHRAKAVAAAWRGSLDSVESGAGFCQGGGSSSSSRSSTAVATTVTTTVATTTATTGVTTAAITSATTTTAATTTAITVTDATSTSTSPSSTTSAVPPSGSTTARNGSVSKMAPLRGIAYGALPCNSQGCQKTGWVNEDMLQDAYAKQWGPEGRDDLQTMAWLGANTVRLYHSLGLDVQHNHGGFLDRAQAVGLNVMPGYHTEAVHTHCADFDCFEAWKSFTLEGFKYGFRQGNQWHPAISALILLNEPDFLTGDPACSPSGAWCRVKAFLSALDGVLAAEREAGVEPGHVRLTVTWSFGMMPSIDDKESGPGLFGFQDTIAGIANPKLAGYTPRSTQAELESAFRTRWMHGVNTQAPWSFVKEVISSKYADRFGPVPWFIGEYGANGQTAFTIRSDLEDMQRTAEEEGSNFLGAAFFQFQTAHFKGGAELNFGLFKLGSEKLWEIDPPCDITVQLQPNRCPTKWPVYCLSDDLDWLPGSLGHRAEALADAWKGSLQKVESGRGYCKGAGRRLDAVAGRNGTRIACQIRSSAVLSAQDVGRRLEDNAFSAKLEASTKKALVNNQEAILGKLQLENEVTATVGDATEGQAQSTDSRLKKWLPQIIVVSLLLVACLLALWGFLAHKQRKAAQARQTAYGADGV